MTQEVNKIYNLNINNNFKIKCIIIATKFHYLRNKVIYIDEIIQKVNIIENKFKHLNYEIKIDNLEKVYIDFNITHIVIRNLKHLDSNLKWKIENITIDQTIGGFNYNTSSTKSILFKIITDEKKNI